MKQTQWLISKFLVLPLVIIFASCSSAKVRGSADMSGIKENNSVVNEYVNYVAANNNLTPDHHYIQTALIKLAEAISAMGSKVGYTIKQDLGMSNQHAIRITENANEATHADHIRKAADILSSELQSLQRSKYMGMSVEADAVKSASVAIDPAVLTRNQKAAIMNFFSTSAAILSKMN